MSLVHCIVTFLGFLLFIMATGGKGTPTGNVLKDTLTPDKIDLMIEMINEHTDYKVVTSDEFGKMRDALKFKAESTPITKPKFGLPKPDFPNLKVKQEEVLGNAHHQGVGQHDMNIPNLQPYSKPRIPIFSGEEKSEVSFDVWKYEVKCIIHEKTYSDAILLQCIRGSLKGKARTLLLSLDEGVTPLGVIEKLEGVYGNVFTSETLLQQFYSENQQPNQSVAEYGMKLENLVQLAIEKGQMDQHTKNSMLRAKFWSGLRDPMLKNASRYKYDTVMDFDQLRKEIRSIELDLSNSGNLATEAKVQQQSVDAQSEKLDRLLESMKSLNKKVEKLEGELKQVKDKQFKPNYNQGQYQDNNQGEFQDNNQGQYRGQYKGQNRGYRKPGYKRGQFRGRGFNGNQTHQNRSHSDNLNG